MRVQAVISCEDKRTASRLETLSVVEDTYLPTYRSLSFIMPRS